MGYTTDAILAREFLRTLGRSGVVKAVEPHAGGAETVVLGLHNAPTESGDWPVILVRAGRVIVSVTYRGGLLVRSFTRLSVPPGSYVGGDWPHFRGDLAGVGPDARHPGLAGNAAHGDPALGPGLGLNGPAIGADGAEGDVEDAGGFLVGDAHGDELEDGQLLSAEPAD